METLDSIITQTNYLGDLDGSATIKLYNQPDDLRKVDLGHFNLIKNGFLHADSFGFVDQFRCKPCDYLHENPHLNYEVMTMLDLPKPKQKMKRPLFNLHIDIGESKEIFYEPSPTGIICNNQILS